MMIIGCRVSQVSRFSKRAIPRPYAVESLLCTQRWRKKYTSPASISAPRRKRTMGQILLGSGVIGELVEFSAFEKFAFPTGIELASLDQNLGELVEKLTSRFTATFTSPQPNCPSRASSRYH